MNLCKSFILSIFIILLNGVFFVNGGTGDDTSLRYGIFLFFLKERGG